MFPELPNTLQKPGNRFSDNRKSNVSFHASESLRMTEGYS